MSRFFAFLALVLLAGCSSSAYRAPVAERGDTGMKIGADAARKKAQREADWRPKVHVVQKGETLFGIAFNYGFDYRELAQLNGIQNPSLISIGQQIRLFPDGAEPAGSTANTNVTTAAPVETKPIEIKPADTGVKEQPKLAKYAYSEEAMAQIEKVQHPAKADTAMVAKVDSKKVTETKPESKPEPKPEPKPKVAADASSDDAAEDAMEWSLPAKGKVVGEFSEAANRKGIDIAGKLGQPVMASAPGKVVYSGAGLRGYGKLIIIKHNKTYLSAYAHNDQILVKEGQHVTRGQKIAEMGNSDASQVMLHFEVRRLGKPVDPAKYLPLGKS